MEARRLGPLGEVSVLALGGGGLGQVWGETSRAEAVATVRAAIDAGITLLDVAPMYGRGEAERVVGEAFAGKLPSAVRIGTKVMVGDPGPGAVWERVERSVQRSLDTMELERVDVVYLHSNIVPDDYRQPRHQEFAARLATPWTRYVDEVRPAFARLVADGRIGTWGITGVGLPRTIRAAIADDPAPGVVQCVTNLLDSVGSIYVHDLTTRAQNRDRGRRRPRVWGARDPGGAGGRTDRRDGPAAAARRPRPAGLRPCRAVPGARPRVG